MIIGQRIKEQRLYNKMSQTELAKSVGCSQPMITLWEREICEPTASAILKLSEVFNCSTDYLLGKSDI